MRKETLLLLIMVFPANYIFAFNPDIEIKFLEGNFGMSYVHHIPENKNTISYDIDIIKIYTYDKNIKFGLDLIPLSINLLDNWKDINYSSFLNIDFHYSPFSFVDIFYIQLYFAGGPGGITYTIHSDKYYEENKQIFDVPLFNASLGIRFRLIHFTRWDYPNFDLYCEYNILKEDFKTGFYARFFTPLTPLFMLIRSSVNKN